MFFLNLCRQPQVSTNWSTVAKEGLWSLVRMWGIDFDPAMRFFNSGARLGAASLAEVANPKAGEIRNSKNRTVSHEFHVGGASVGFRCKRFLRYFWQASLNNVCNQAGRLGKPHGVPQIWKYIMGWFGLDANSVADRTRSSGHVAEIPCVRSSIGRGIFGFILLSIAGFAPGEYLGGGFTAMSEKWCSMLFALSSSSG
jgi:hypothetical protein